MQHLPGHRQGCRHQHVRTFVLVRVFAFLETKIIVGLQLAVHSPVARDTSQPSNVSCMQIGYIRRQTHSVVWSRRRSDGSTQEAAATTGRSTL
jgi:hypothetical protein